MRILLKPFTKNVEPSAVLRTSGNFLDNFGLDIHPIASLVITAMKHLRKRSSGQFQLNV